MNVLSGLIIAVEQILEYTGKQYDEFCDCDKCKAFKRLAEAVRLAKLEMNSG